MNRVTTMRNGKAMKNVVRIAAMMAAALWSLNGSAGIEENDVGILTVSQAGLHRVTHEELLANGVDLNGFTHRRIVVSYNGEPLPRYIEGRLVNNRRSNKFGEGASITFYMPEFNNLYSREAALVISINDRAQSTRTQRIRIRNSDSVETSYRATTQIEEQATYDFLSPLRDDPWHYGMRFAFGPSDVDVPGTSVDFSLDQLVGSTADVTAQIFGLSDIDVEGNDHHVVGVVNGLEAADEQFDGNVVHDLKMTDVPVNEGQNTFRFDFRSIEATPFDVMALNMLTVEYDRQAIAQNERIVGSFAPNKVYELSGFTDTDIEIFRIDDDGELVRVLRTRNDGEGSIQFKSTSTEARYVAASELGYLAVDDISREPVLEDISSGSAEYLIISHSDFIGSSALDTFVGLRSGQYSVKVVDVQQIYHQFSDLHTPSYEGIEEYIKFAEENLGTQYVLFVGGDTYDYKDYLGRGSRSFVPTQYAVTRGDGLTIRQAPSDAKYGDLDDDGIPDLPVGRFPVRTVEELGNIVEKINDYEARQGYVGRILMVADQEDSGNGVNFVRDAEALLESIPSQFAKFVRSDFRAFPESGNAQVARDKIFTAINAGTAVMAYMGHSSQESWGRTSPALLTQSDISAFNNIDKPTLVTQWGCWNTYFVHPDGDSLAELFLNPGLNGAATVLGASTLTKASSEFLLAQELNRFMYNRGETIGSAVIKAKQALSLIEESASDVQLGWQILGDPALVINQ